MPCGAHALHVLVLGSASRDHLPDNPRDAEPDRAVASVSEVGVQYASYATAFRDATTGAAGLDGLALVNPLHIGASACAAAVLKIPHGRGQCEHSGEGQAPKYRNRSI